MTTNTTTGCTYNTFAQTTIFSNTLSLTLAASPPTVCLLSSGNSTLTAGGANTYTWMPGSFTVNPLQVTVSSTNNPVFTVMGSNTLGCIATKTIQLGITETEASFNSIPNICNTATIDLNVYSVPNSLTSSPAGTYSLNGVATNSIVGPLPAGVYTVSYNYTAAVVCTPTAQITFTVLPNTITPTISATATLICGGGIPTITLTALPITQNYYWQNNGATNFSIVVSPTANTIYTVQAGSSYGNCIQTATFAINTTTIPCGCYAGCSNILPTVIYTVSPAANSVYCINNNINITGVVTFSNSDFRIYPNMSITVGPYAVLNITGSHLYSCDNMWQGIIVQEGGRVNINVSSTNRTSLIEDAFVAVDFLATSTSYSANGILFVDNATFNRNQTAIRIGDYGSSQTTYPFSIVNSLFTSRTITFTPLNHPSTSTIKNSFSGNGSPLQTPYISNNSYPALGLKAPLAGAMPYNGIVLNEVGFTNSTTLTTTFYGITIGNSTVAANFNCFDNLRQDITATNSNFLLSNNVFQEGQRYGKGLSAGGKAIVANSAAVAQDVKGARNNQIQIVSVSTSTALNNRFYEKVACADINGYINIEIKNAQAYSYANGYSGYTLINAIGDRGFNVVTNRYFNIIFDNNRIYNIKNAMLTGIDNASVWFASGTGGNSRLVGKINVTNNIVNKHPIAAAASEYVNIGFSLSDPFSSATTNIALTGSSNFIQGNNFGNVHNGISVANVAFSSVSIYSNNITLVNEPNSLGAPIQNGIYTTQLGTSVIQQNNIAGPTTFTNDISAIKTSMNNLLTVKCNTTANTYHGLNFNASQAVTTVQDNIMQNQKYGISMTNTATIGTQGTSTSPTNNQWLGSWAGNFKTMNYNQYSSAQTSKIYATWGGTLDPNGSGTVIATPGAMFFDNYYHQTSDPNNTILNSSSISPSCRTGGGGGSEGGSGFAAMTSPNVSTTTISINQKALLENLVNNSTSNLANEVKYIDKNRVYRTLAANSSYTAGSAVLSTFYTNAQNSCMNKFLEVEKDLASGSITSAQNKLAAITTTNNVENNYNAYYNLYIKLKNATFSSADSSVLLNLCNQCPYLDGGIVYQARALYNIMNNSYAKFHDNCSLSVGSRLFDDIVKDETDINVLIKTKLYPNPNNGEFTVELNQKNENLIEEIAIYDLSGKLLNTISESGSLIKVNTKLLKGTYLIKVRLNNKSVDVHRIIID